MGNKQVDPLIDLAECLHNPEEVKNEKLFAKVFKRYDRDGDGNLDKEEFKVFSAALFKVDIQDAKIEAAKQVKEHFGLASGSREAQTALHLANKSIDGCLEEKHMKQMLNNFLNDADLSASEKISFEDFKQFLKRHSSFTDRERIGLRGTKYI